MDDETPPPYNYHRHRSSRHPKTERTSSSSRRKKDKASGRHVEHHHSHGSTKSDHRKRERSSKKSSTRQDRTTRRRTSFVITRPRTPPVDILSSSDEDDSYRPDREELRAALKRDVPVSKVDTSSLKRKLKGVQKCVTEFIACKVDDDQEEAEINASIEIMDLLETLADQKILAGLSYVTSNEKEETLEQSNDVEVFPATPTALEEQELRLAALKSAILKKHEARKKRRVIEARPYSPTDTDILLDDPEPIVGDAKFGPDNMEISPPASPELPDKTLLCVDMDIASDCSQGPIYTVDDTPTPCFDLNDQWIPLPPDGNHNDISTFSIFQKHSPLLPPPPPPPVPVEDDGNYSASEDEDVEALRALLLSDQQAKKKRAATVDQMPAPKSSPANVEPDRMELDDSDADDLRALVLQSIAKKSETKQVNTIESLKKAVQRLNGCQQSIAAVPTPVIAEPIAIPKPVAAPPLITVTITQPIAEPLGSIAPPEPVQTIPVRAIRANKRKIISHLPAETETTTIVPEPTFIVNIPAAKKPRSALVTNPNPKQIRPVVIRFAPEGSSSSEESDDPDSRFGNVNSASLDRFFDPSSPASIAMDSPAYAPSSPNHVVEMGDSNSATITDGPIPPSPSVFEQKLDEYLRNVRSKNATAPSAAPKTPITAPVKSKHPATPLVSRWQLAH